MHFKLRWRVLMRSPPGSPAAKSFPNPPRQPGGDVLSSTLGCQTNQACHGLIEINDAACSSTTSTPSSIVVEQRFEKAALAARAAGRPFADLPRPAARCGLALCRENWIWALGIEWNQYSRVTICAIKSFVNQKWALMAQKKFKTVKDAMLGCLNHAQEVWGGDTPSFQ